eukprot:1368527-Rhodomonas_salina.2
MSCKAHSLLEECDSDPVPVKAAQCRVLVAEKQPTSSAMIVATVSATNYANMTSEMSTSQSVRIDQRPPLAPRIWIQRNVDFGEGKSRCPSSKNPTIFQSLRNVDVVWEQPRDSDSGLQTCTLALIELNGIDHGVQVEEEISVDSMPGTRSLDDLWTILQGKTYVIEFRATDMAGAHNHSRTDEFVLEFTNPVPGTVLIQQDSTALQEHDGIIFVRGKDPVTISWSGFHASTPICFEVGVFTMSFSDGGRIWIERGTEIVNQTSFSLSSLSGASKEPHWAEVCAFDNGGNSVCAVSMPYLPEFEAFAPVQVEVTAIDARMSTAEGSIEWLVHARWSLPQVENQHVSSVWCCLGSRTGDSDLLPCQASSGDTFCSVNIPGSNYSQPRFYLTVAVETISGLRSNASSRMHLLDQTGPSVAKIVPIPTFESSDSVENRIQPFFEVENQLFQTSQTTLRAAIVDVHDKESGLTSLLGRVCWNSLCGKYVEVGSEEMLFQNLSLAVGTVAYFELLAVNGQGLRTTLISEGIEVSQFLPPIGFVHDGNNSVDVDFTSKISTSSCSWNHELGGLSAFSHWEAVLLEFPPVGASLSLRDREVSIMQENWIQFWQTDSDRDPWWVDFAAAGTSLIAGPIKVEKDRTSAVVDGLSLQNGTRYFWALLGCSNARRCSATLSDGFSVEVDRPAVGCVSIAGIVSSTTAAEYVFVSSPAALAVAFAVQPRALDIPLEICEQPFADSLSPSNSTSHLAFARMRLEPIRDLVEVNGTNLSKAESDVQVQLVDVSRVRGWKHPCCSTSPILFDQHRELGSLHVGTTFFNVVASVGDSVAISTTSSILILNVESNDYHILTQDLGINHKFFAFQHNFALQREESLVFYDFDSDGTMQARTGPDLGSEECFILTRTRQLIVLSATLGAIRVYVQDHPGGHWQEEAQFQLQFDVDPDCKLSSISAATFMFRSTSQIWQVLRISSDQLHHIGSFSAPPGNSLSTQSVGESGETGIIAIGNPTSLDGSGSLTVLLVNDDEIGTMCSIPGVDQQQLGLRTAISVVEEDELLIAASLGNGSEAVVLFDVQLLRQTCT